MVTKKGCGLRETIKVAGEKVTKNCCGVKVTDESYR